MMINKQKILQLLFATVLVLGMSNIVQADTVNVWGDSASYVNTVNGFYDSLADHSSTVIVGSLDSNDLTGVDLLWAIQPADAYTAAEINTMADFLAVGGRLAFVGEHATFLGSGNEHITAAAAALGAHIVISNVSIDSGYHVATRAGGMILDHTLTEGVDTFRYGLFARLDISAPAEALMLGEDITSVQMAFENIGPGSVFIISDQNVFDDLPIEDNELMFENLLIGITGAPPPTPGLLVPVPTMSVWALIMLTLLFGFMVHANRRRLF